MRNIYSINKSVHSIKAFIIFISCIVFTFTASAEGTKQLMPNSNDDGYLSLYAKYNLFAQYNASYEERLHIKVYNVGEVI